MSSFSSGNLQMSSSEENASYDNASARLLGRRRPIHDILGGGLVGDILLWRNPKVSTLMMLGITIIWLLFEVIEYSFITLVCHISITIMLSFFIWRTLAELLKWKLPQIPVIVLQESTLKHAVIALLEKFNQVLSKLVDISTGKDIKTFFVAMGSLLMLALIGNYISSLNLVFISYVFGQTLPFIYEKYQDDVDYFVGQMHQEMKLWYNKFDENVIKKIPKGPSFERKIR